MVSHTNYSEDALVEQPAIALFSDLEYETANCYNETFGEQGTLGRETSGEVILVPRLRAALERLNPDLPSEAISFAILRSKLGFPWGWRFLTNAQTIPSWSSSPEHAKYSPVNADRVQSRTLVGRPWCLAKRSASHSDINRFK